MVTATEIGEDMDGVELQQKEYEEFKKVKINALNSYFSFS